MTSSLLIKNALVHDGLGSTLPGHDVYVVDGKINAVGTGLAMPAHRTLDADGMDLFPGFIAALAPWGGIGPSLQDDHLADHTSLVAPHLDVSYAFQPDGVICQQLHRWGITATCLTPAFDSLFSGLAAVYKTQGQSYGSFLLRPRVFLAASLASSVKAAHTGKRYAQTDMGLFHLLGQTLLDVAKGKLAGTPEGDVLEQVLDGQMPLVLHCDSLQKWQHAKAILKAYPRLRCVLAGAYEMDLATLKNGESHTPAILFSMADASFASQSGVDFDAIDGVVRAGVPVAASPYLAESAMTHGEALLWNAALLYKNGLEAETVTQMLCSMPARILGVDDRVGSIRPGLDADLVLWTGHPVKSFAAQPRHVFVNGREAETKEAARFCW